MNAVSAGTVDGLSRGELNHEITKMEKELKRRLPVGWHTGYQSLVKEFVNTQGYSNHSLERALFLLEKRDIIRFSNQVRLLFVRLLVAWQMQILINPCHRRKNKYIGLGSDSLGVAFFRCFYSFALVVLIRCV